MAIRREYYSEEKHAQRLRTMLLQVTEALKSMSEETVEEMVLPKMCPATPEFKTNEYPTDYWMEDHVDYHPCNICCHFVGLYNYEKICPCIILENPISDSFKALKEKGYEV